MALPVKFAAGAAVLVMLCGAAAAQQYTVESGTTKPVRLSKPASSVVIGNQNIADVAVADPQLVFLTGKTFGTTNLIVLDEDNNILVSANVVVTANSANLVTVNRAGSSFTYDCPGECRDAPMIGDDPAHFSNAASQAQQSGGVPQPLRALCGSAAASYCPRSWRPWCCTRPPRWRPPSWRRAPRSTPTLRARASTSPSWTSCEPPRCDPEAGTRRERTARIGACRAPSTTGFGLRWRGGC